MVYAAESDIADYNYNFSNVSFMDRMTFVEEIS